MTGPAPHHDGQRARGAVEGGILEIDDCVVVACTVEDALTILSAPEAVATWFGSRRDGPHSVIASAHRDLHLIRDQEIWQPERGLLAITARSGHVGIVAYLTLRAVVQVTDSRQIRPGTEIWVHVELRPAKSATREAAVLRVAIRRALHHLRLELDADIHAPW